MTDANLDSTPDRRPHSRACGPRCGPGHGAHCASDCPSCRRDREEPSSDHDPVRLQVTVNPVALLTDAEHDVMEQTATLTRSLRDIVPEGTSRDHDLADLLRHVHVIQRAVLAQAAARAYPDRYRLLGGDPHPPSPGPFTRGGVIRGLGDMMRGDSRG